MSAAAAARAAGALLAGLLAGVAVPSHAQIGITTASGWTVTLAGNVNAFYVFERESKTGRTVSPGALVGAGGSRSAVRSGYLPAYLVVDAKGTENGLALGVHFGVAPQIGTDESADEGSRARIDFRQAYLTVGGNWGQLLAGRELGVFQRQSFLADMSLFGVGATGGGVAESGRPVLGRSGYGYLYPGFDAQLAYSTPTGRAIQFTVSLADPAANNGFTELPAPRVEAEASWRRGGAHLWAGTLVQSERDTALDAGATAWGLTAGGRIEAGTLGVVVSAYTGRGIGTTFRFADGRTADSLGAAALRASHGLLAQVAWNPAKGPLTVAASAGGSVVASRVGEPAFTTKNRSATAGIYLRATPSLRLAAELTLARSSDDDGLTPHNTSTAVATGVMLFF